MKQMGISNIVCKRQHYPVLQYYLGIFQAQNIYGNYSQKLNGTQYTEKKDFSIEKAVFILSSLFPVPPLDRGLGEDIYIYPV